MTSSNTTTQDEFIRLITAKGDSSSNRKQAFLQVPIAFESPESLPHSRIPLEDKAIPTSDKITSDPELANRSQIVFAGKIDPDLFSRFQERLRQGGEEIWHPEGQTTNGFNAPPLKRAYHDAIGINKILFAFSDDLLTQSFRMPWWYEWYDEFLGPIFEQLNINPKTVVRALLTRMPADCLIDIHHDTGRWTTRTHRMHIPVFTNPQRVAFLAGLTPSTMQRVNFVEGYCLELNNRAKHAVFNGWDQGRVHFIFDWVEGLETLSPPLIFRDLDQTCGVIQHRRAIWYFDQSKDPNDFPELPASESTAIVRKQALNALLAKFPPDATRTQKEDLVKLIENFEIGEILSADLLTLVAHTYPYLLHDHNYFIENFAECIRDVERKFDLLTNKN